MAAAADPGPICLPVSSEGRSAGSAFGGQVRGLRGHLPTGQRGVLVQLILLGLLLLDLESQNKTKW